MTYENLKKLVKYGRKIQVVDDNDLFVGVTGSKGSGKTSFSIQYSREYVKDYFNESYFSVGKYVAFNNKDIFNKMHTLPVYSPLIADEAIRIAWSREWNKMDNKELTKFSAQVRPKKHIVFMNIPKLAWIDKAYREGMLDMWVWIHSIIEDGVKKCFAIVFEPDENQGETDSWHLKLLKKTHGRIERIGRFTDMDKIYKIVKNHPCFMDLFPFPKVPDDIYKQYMELRDKKVMERESEYVDQKEMAKVMSYNLKYKWDKIIKAIQEGRFSTPTYRMISDILCYDPSRKKQMVKHTTVRNWVNEILQAVSPQTLLQDADNKTEQENQEAAGITDGETNQERSN